MTQQHSNLYIKYVWNRFVIPSISSHKKQNCLQLREERNCAISHTVCARNCLNMYSSKDAGRSEKLEKPLKSHVPRTLADQKCAIGRNAPTEGRGGNRYFRRQMAGETVEISQRGSYIVQQSMSTTSSYSGDSATTSGCRSSKISDEASGEMVTIKKDVEKMIANSKLYAPDELLIFHDNQPPHSKKNGFVCKFEASQESTLQACRRIVHEQKTKNERYDVAALNFASAKNPGGGFLKGSNAQEESLARSSALYLSLTECGDDMYRHNRKKLNGGLYSDYMIYSHEVPVFRADDANNALLPGAEVYCVSFVSAPAVNATIAKKKYSQDVIMTTITQRMKRVLQCFALNNHRTIVLGAWGCGVFGNDVHLIARLFIECLGSDLLRGCFDRVVFASIDANEVQVFNDAIQGIK